MEIEGGLAYQNAGTPVNGTTESQTITPSAAPASGTFKLKFEGFTTSALAWNISAANMQTALNALPSIAAGGVGVALGGGVYTITFSGANMAKRDQPLIEVVDNLVLDAGAAAVTLTVAESVAGVRATHLGAQKGATCYDTTNGILYINTGTAAAPDWNPYIPSDVVSVAEFEVLDGVVAGTVTASKALVVGATKNLNELKIGALDITDRILINVPPAAYDDPAFGIGVYGTPVVDVSLLDNIAFTVNMSLGTNKTAEDTSSMAAFIGIKNTADVVNAKMQGLLVSNNLGFDCFDAYAVQGHVTVGAAGMSTKNANAHISGLSGKALLSGAVGQGWVTGVLGIIDGAGAVTGLCHAIAGQIEAGVTGADAILYLGADAVVPSAIELAGVANMTAFLTVNAVGGCVIANALVPAAAPDAGTMGADAVLKVMIGVVPYYIPMYDTLHA